MKSIKVLFRYSLVMALFTVLLSTGCQRQEPELDEAKFPNTAEVFIDGFSAGLEYSAFGDSKVTAFTVDEDVSFEGVFGSVSMRFDIPNEGDPEGPYAGGVFRDLGGRDLTGYDALTFYAKASKAGTVDLIGFGNDFEGDKYSTTASVKLSTSWAKYVIPIPDPSKLTREKGLFVISEGPEDGDGYSIWLDVVKFEKLGTIAQPRPKIFNGEDVNSRTFIGVTSKVTGLSQTVNLSNGGDQTVDVTPAYFEFTSSNTDVARVDENGSISIVGIGEARITGKLNGVDAAGSLNITSAGEFVHAPTPTQDSTKVISVFSDAYTNIPIDFYNGFFEPFQRTLGGADIVIDGDNIIKYSQLNFVATEFKNPTVDASEMTHFHVDVQIENPIEDGDFITIQLGDFGPDGIFGTPDDASGSVKFETSPPLVSNEWISFDIPFSAFEGLTTRANLAQIFFITDGSVPELAGTITDILVDNMYFYQADDVPPGPCVAETSQSLDASDFNLTFQIDPGSAIISEGGNYTYVDNPDAENVVNNSCKVGQIFRDGNTFANTQIVFDSKFDFNVNSGFKLKVWSPVSGTNVLVKLEDKGDQNSFAEVSAVTTIASGWEELTFDFAAGESGKYDKITLFFELNSNVVETYYIDDFRLYDAGGGGGGEPTMAAPIPDKAASNVISIYSDEYDDIAFDNFDAGWCGGAAVTGVQIEGNNTLKKNAGIDCHGIDFSSNRQDLTDYTHIHFDFYTNDTDLVGDVFNVKLVDFAGGGGEASNLQININTGTIPAIVANNWVPVDVDITSLGGVVAGDLTRSDIAQIGITTANLTNVWYDNIYFYKEGSAATCAPETGQSLSATDFNLNFETDPASAIVSDGGAYSYFDNPDFENAVNSSCKVGQIVRDGNTFANTQIVFDSKFDFTTNSGFKLKVWSPVASTNVLVKLEDKADGNIKTEVAGVTSVVSGWEELTFDFAPGESGKYDKITLFFELNSNVVETYYIDDFMLYGDGGSGPVIPTDAPPTPPARNAADVVSIYGEAYGTAVGLNNVPWDGNTVFTEENIASNNVLRVDFDGFMGSDLGSVADASAMTHFHMDFFISDGFSAGQIFNPKWSNHAGGAGETSSFELTRAIGGDDVQKWVSIDVPITDFATGDNTQRGELAQYLISVAGLIDVAYIDNIYFYKEGSAATCDPETGQSLGAADFNLNFETDPASAIVSDGSAYSYFDNPDFENAVNSSCKVGQIVRDGNTFANTQIVFDSKFDFTTNSGFKLKVWSPVASTNVLVKLEDKADGNIKTEVAGVTSVVSGWEELTFDFAPGESNKYDKIVLFFEPNTSVVETYYIDDFMLYGDGGGGVPSSIVDLSFSDAASISNWNKVADATGSEATITWVSEGGVEGGAMEIAASNPTTDGKAYIFQLDLAGLNFDGATDVQLTFDLKLGAPLVAAAVHLQTNIPGPGVVNNFDLQAIQGGLSESAYNSYTFDFSGITPGAETFSIHFNFASGAVSGSGGVLLVDNIKLIKTD